MLSFQLNQQFYAQNANIIKFDHSHELLWVGDTQGCMKSYNQGQVYTSTAVSKESVIDVHIDKDIVYGIGPSTLKGINSRGVPKLFQDGFQDLSCLTTSQKFLHLGGDCLTDIDVATNKIVYTRNYPTTRIKSHYSHLYTANQNQLNIIDINSDECLAVNDASGIITNIECFGNYVLTTGTTLQNGHYKPDPFVKLFDIRSLKLIKVIPFSMGAVHLKPHPRVNSVFFIGSLDGNLMFHDITNNKSTNCQPLNTMSSDIDISSSADCIAAVDNFGGISIFASSDVATFNSRSVPLEYATPVPDHAEMSFGDSFSLAGKPTRGKDGFLSDDMSMFTNKKIIPPQIDAAILKATQYKDNVGYAPNLKQFKRNQYHFGKIDKPLNDDQIIFHSQKKSHKKQSNSNASSPMKESPNIVPEHYLCHDIKYSKFGVEDFDFTIFNQTQYPGLENHIKNCYLNSLLFLYYFIPDFKHFCNNHILVPCDLLNCFICELGFLFKMLDTAKGVNCQASNFLMAFTNNPKTDLLCLGEPLEHLQFHDLIQKSNSFILEQMFVDASSNEKLLFENYFGYKYDICKICSSCQFVTKSNVCQFVLNLNYSSDATCFEDVFNYSLNTVDATNKLTCKNCNKTTLHEISKTLVKFPNVLLINTNATKTLHKSIYWSNSKEFVKGGPNNQNQIPNQLSINQSTYDLMGNLCQITTDNKEHFISQLNDNTAWIHFNDFLVQSIPAYEVTQNPKGWKTPSILLFRKQDYIQLPINTLDKADLIEFLKSNPSSVSPILSPSIHPVIPLQRYENIGSGFMCALDAEFVSLQEELVEFKSDGSKTVKRPSRLHLARVSILRGEGFHEGKPFIDDYIVPKEEIQDYLTQFSGIKPGDLDPKTSRKRLLHLKTVYKKIRWLIDLGCIFVGHGLKKDLRIISNSIINVDIHIPSHQIIDTVDLYHLKQYQRFLSLKYLAFKVLRKHIQTESHDSIEDALTSLELYKYYQTIEDVPMFLKRLYEDGRRNNFKIE